MCIRDSLITVSPKIIHDNNLGLNRQVTITTIPDKALSRNSGVSRISPWEGSGRVGFIQKKRQDKR